VWWRNKEYLTDWQRVLVNYWMSRHSQRAHPEPFNKTRRGYARRQQRKFKAATQQGAE
jgi:hypothetical protein